MLCNNIYFCVKLNKYESEALMLKRSEMETQTYDRAQPYFSVIIMSLMGFKEARKEQR